MASASKTEIYDVPVEKFYQALIDYQSYPEFVEGVSGIDIQNQSADGATVTYHINLIKKFSYTINLSHEENAKVSWTLDSGDLLKVNNGSWSLKDLGDGKTEVTYSLEVEVKGFFPGLGMIEKTLVSTNLPATMKAFAKRAAQK